MTAWTAPILVLALTGATALQADDPVAVVGAFHDALAAGDGDAALAQLAPDVVIFESGGAEMSRQEYADHHLGGDMQFAAATSQQVDDQQAITAGDIAYVLTRSRTTGRFRDRDINSLGVESMILRRGTEGWRIVHIHWSSRAERAGAAGGARLLP